MKAIKKFLALLLTAVMAFTVVPVFCCTKQLRARKGSERGAFVRLSRV